MAKLIKNIEVKFSWQGDNYALQGFNFTITPSSSNPTNTLNQIYYLDYSKVSYDGSVVTHTIQNVTLDSDINYTVWLQACYEGKDSDWVSLAKGTVSDDGTSTIETKSSNIANQWTYTSDITKIDGGKIFTGTVTADKLQANTITATSGVIANAAITTAMIKDANITTAKIGDAQITTAKIGDVQITNAKIFDLDGTKITAASIAADKLVIGSGDVSSGNLMAGKTITSNVATSNTIPTDGAKVVGSSYMTIGAGTQVNNAAENAYAQIDLGAIFRISENRIYFFGADSRSYLYKLKYSSDGSNWYYAAGNSSNTGWCYSSPSVNGEPKVNPTLDLFSIPISARYLRLYMNGNNINSGNHIYEWECYSVSQTTIHGGQISTGTVTADRLVTGTITAASGIIADAAIGTAQIANAAITNAKINDLDASKINAGTINADRIGSSSITTEKLKVGSGEQGGYLNNPRFAKWTGTYPDGTSIWSTGGIVKQVVDNVNVAEFNCDVLATQRGMTLNTPFFANGMDLDGLKYFCLEMRFRITSGTNAYGAALLVDIYRQDNTNQRLQLNCSDAGSSLTLNKWYTIRKIFEITDANVEKTYKQTTGYLLANYSSAGGGNAVKTIQFASVNMYLATKQDFLTQNWTVDETLINGGSIKTKTLSANSIFGGTLVLGGSSNGNGLMSILNASNAEVIKADNTGITIDGAYYKTKVDGILFDVVQKRNIFINSNFEKVSMSDYNSSYDDYSITDIVGWYQTGTPTLASQFETGGVYSASGNYYAVCVNSSNYIQADLYTQNIGAYYTVSGVVSRHFMRSGSVTVTARVRIHHVDATNSWDPTTPTYSTTVTLNSAGKKRFSYTFQLTSALANVNGTKGFFVFVDTTNSGWAVFDSLQLVEGSLPAMYIPPESKPHEFELVNTKVIYENGRRPITSISKDGWPGLVTPEGDSTWLRTTVNGIIPYQSGSASNLGTSSWRFNSAWIDGINSKAINNENKITSWGGVQVNGYSNTGLFSGSGDGAGYENANIHLQSWYGIGFKSSYDNINRIVFNTRNGDIGTRGVISINCDGGERTLTFWKSSQRQAGFYSNDGATLGAYDWFNGRQIWNYSQGDARLYLSRETFSESNFVPRNDNVQVCGNWGYCWYSVRSFRFEQGSDRNKKYDISKAETEYAYETVKTMQPYLYRYNSAEINEDATDEQKEIINKAKERNEKEYFMGVMVDEAPVEIISHENQKSIDIYSYTTMLLGALQETIKKVEDLENEIKNLRGDV